MVTPLAFSGLLTKNPSRMYQVYSRRSPQIGTRPVPRNSICSRSSRMYCWSFFQLSSRRATTSFMNASRSVWAWAGTAAPPRASATIRRAEKSLGITANTLAEALEDETLLLAVVTSHEDRLAEHL